MASNRPICTRGIVYQNWGILVGVQGLNHVVFGSLIAVTIKEPTLAVPLALVSHFALDTIPHYGEHGPTARGTKGYHIRIMIDLVACLAFVFFALALGPPNPALLAVCAFLAVAPDFLWPLAVNAKHDGLLWAFFKFHKRIQTESKNGIWVEIPWFLVTTALVIIAIR